MLLRRMAPLPSLRLAFLLSVPGWVTTLYVGSFVSGRLLKVMCTTCTLRLLEFKVRRCCTNPKPEIDHDRGLAELSNLFKIRSKMFSVNESTTSIGLMAAQDSLRPTTCLSYHPRTRPYLSKLSLDSSPAYYECTVVAVALRSDFACTALHARLCGVSGTEHLGRQLFPLSRAAGGILIYLLQNAASIYDPICRRRKKVA